MSEVLTPGWAVVPLGRVAQVQLGKMLSAAAKTGQGTRPYLRNINVRWHRIDVDDVFTMDFNEREVEKFALRVGDVLVCEGGEPGRAAVWKDQLPGALYQKALHRVRFIDGAVDPNFFVYQLELLAATGDLARRFTGSTIKHLPRESFIELPLRVAPIAEQRRIVAALEEHLSALDAAVAGLERARVNARRYFEAELAKVFADGETGAQPWQVRTLQDAISSSVIGLDRGREQQNATGDGYPYVKMGDVTLDGSVRLDSLVHVKASENERARFGLLDGDLLFNTRNSKELVGKVGLVRRPPPGALFNNNLMRIRPATDVLPEFLVAQMIARPFRQRLEQVKRATTNVAAIYAKDLLPLTVHVPSLDVQHAVVARLERARVASERACADIEVQITRAARLRQSILHRAFSGGLVPQDPADESAAESLATARVMATPEASAASSPRGRRRVTTPRLAHG